MPQPAARVGFWARLSSAMPPVVIVGPLKYTAIRLTPSNRLLRTATRGATPPKLPPAPMIVVLDAPEVPGSVKRSPSIVTSGALILMPWLAPLTETVASLTRPAFGVVGVVGSFGEMPALGPANVRLLAICTAVATG